MYDGVLIIFGATGDLAKRKLFPALYRILKKERFKNLAIVATAIEDVAMASILANVRVHIKDVDEELWARFSSLACYFQMDLTDVDAYEKLRSLVESLEQKYQFTSGNRFAYLAVASHFFCTITQALGQSGVIQRKSSNRIIYEKPFGKDAQSAHEINECIAEWFEEVQVYRVDHYLTKELVNNIALLRYTNCVFEPLWNNKYIEQVHIVLSELQGVENRGSYYDQYGVVRDVMQNHMLQLLALTAMEEPEKLTGDYIRTARARVLKDISVVDGILGQYEGYTNENHVRDNSQTETFALLYCAIANERWRGVPFILKTGKCLDKHEVAIHIQFKQAQTYIAKRSAVDENWLTIRVAPDATFILTLNAKKPGKLDQLITVPMEFCHSCMYGAITPEAYEVLFEEVFIGEQATSVRFDEIESAWKVIDVVYKKQLPLYSYKRATQGPTELDNFSKKYGIRWRT